MSERAAPPPGWDYMTEEETRNLPVDPRVRYPLIINRSDDRCPIDMYIQWNPGAPVATIPAPEDIESLMMMSREIDGEMRNMFYGKLFGE